MENQIEVIENKALTITEQADEMSIINDETNTIADEFLVQIKTLGKAIKEHHDPIVSAAHNAHKVANAAKKKFMEPLDKAEKIIKRKMGVYILEQERKQRVEQARLEAEAKKQAEAEALELAKQAEELGDNERAEEIIEESIEAKPVVVAPPIHKTKNSSHSKKWKWRIKDVSKIKPSFLIPNEKAIGDIVRSMGKNAVNVIGEGAIECYQEVIMSTRTR